MRVVYIISSLNKTGGAERIITEKSNYLAKRYGYDIHIITLFQDSDTPNSYPLSGLVHQININFPYYTQYKYKYPKRLLIKYRLFKSMQKKLTQTINSIDPDILIGVSYSHAELVCTIPCRAKKIIECHEPRALVASDIFNGSFISRFYIKHYYFHVIEKNADFVVTLTNKDKLQWHKAKRVEVIPNFTSMHITHNSTCKMKRVIAVGRLCGEKGFERLIDIWKAITAKHPDWKLDIFGEGKLKNILLNDIKTKKVNNISLCGTTSNISKEYSTSSICAVTSYYEGFSLVILEAMKHGVPCVAFDCPFGPGSIIKDGSNGYLVEDNDNSLFIERLCQLIENYELRKQFSQNSIERAKQYDIDIIMSKWKCLFENLYKDLYNQ